MKSLSQILVTIIRPSSTKTMNHPTIQNWNHRRMDTRSVATLASAADNNPRLIAKLLDPQTVSVESRKIALPLGRTQIELVRLSERNPGRRASMDLLQNAVIQAEQQMGIALPAQHIVLLFADAATRGYEGTNYGSHIVIQQQYDVDDSSHLPATIAHEVAHYYWSGKSDWIDEGMANLLETKAEYARTGKQIATT